MRARDNSEMKGKDKKVMRLLIMITVFMAFNIGCRPDVEREEALEGVDASGPPPPADFEERNPMESEGSGPPPPADFEERNPMEFEESGPPPPW